MALNPFSRQKEEKVLSSYESDDAAGGEELLAGISSAAGAELPGLGDDDGFAAFLSDDDEETALDRAKLSDAGLQKFRSAGGDIEKRLEDSLKDLRRKYPMGGIKTSRFITLEILRDMPEGYLSQFDGIVRSGVHYSQNMISDQGKAEIIGAATNDPTNEALQDEAYRVIHSVAADFMDSHPRGALERAIIISLITNEIIGFGPLDPLWRDRRVDEIICNGPHDIQIEIAGQLSKVPACRFRDAEHLGQLIEQLYGAIGKQVSRTTPIVSGHLHDKSRMEAVHQTVAPNGPNFNIRRHKAEYITPDHILRWGTASEELLTDLGNLIHSGASWLLIGGTGSGKTTLLNALTGYLRPSKRVLTLEDTIEMMPNPNKYLAASMQCLPARPDRPGDMGVTMRDLVKSSLRLRPDIIIVGEVRDSAGYDLCQALNTGHQGCSTVHANSEYDAIYRMNSLVSQGGVMTGTQALPLIAAAFDFIIHVERMPQDGSRKIVSVSEVAPYPVLNERTGEQHLPTNQLWGYDVEGVGPDGKIIGNWNRKGSLSDVRRQRLRMDIEAPLTWQQLQALSAI